MSTRKNPVRAGNKASASQPQPTSHLDTELLASGDAVAPSPTTRQRRGESRASRMYQVQNGAPNSQRGQRVDTSYYDQNGAPEQDVGLSEISEGSRPGGEDWIFKELLIPTSVTPAFVQRQDQTLSPLHYHTSRNAREDMIKEGRTPIPTNSRPALYDLSLQYCDAPQEGSPYSVNTEPVQQTPPDYHYQLTPPNKLMYLTSPIDPRELPPDARNLHGSNYIVQTAEQAYELMKAEAEGRIQHGQMHMPPRPGPGAPIGSVYASGGGGVGYPVYSDPRTQAHVHAHPRQQEQSPPSWPAQPSPASIPRGWQEPSPRTQGRDASAPHQQQQQQQQPMTSPARAYGPPPGWNPNQAQAHPERATPPSPSSAWRPASGPPPPSSQATSTQTTGRTREGSWSQGDPTRPPPPGAPLNRWNGPGQSPVTTGNPASWAGAPPNAGAAGATAAWQGQGMPPRSAGPRQHQPHPDIDGRADDGLRWSASNTADAVVQRGWQAPPENNTTMANSTESGGPVTRYSVDGSGRPIQVRILGPNMRYMMGSNQSSSTAWSPAQGNARPPWATQSMNNPTGVPLDGRIQTPGGTGAMGGHAAAAAAAATTTARPPTATGQMSGPYGAAAGPPGYTAYTNRPGSVQGQPRPGPEYTGGPGPGPGPSGPGGEIPYGSQPDSMAAYRPNNGPGAAAAGMPPPAPSATPGAGGPASQGYAMAGGGPLPTGNPYPAVPPATGAQPYGMSRPGLVSQQGPQGQQQQQQHHQQPPPGAHANMYPNYAVHPGQPPSQANGSVYAPYSTVVGPVGYPMNQGAPMGRPMPRMAPGPGGMQMNAYGQVVGHHAQPSQEMYSRMAQGPAGAGGMDGYRPPQQQH